MKISILTSALCKYYLFIYYYYDNYYIISGLNMWQTIGYVESLERIERDGNIP